MAVPAMMRHLAALACGLLLTGLVFGAVLGVSAEAARERERLTVLFAPGTSPSAILARVVLAEGRIVRETVFPFAVEVVGERPGIAQRLEGTGAWLVLVALPAHAMAVGGCSYLDPGAYPVSRARLAVGPH